MKNSIGGTFVFLAGAISGTFIGFLFAPDSGKNTRRKMSYQLNNSRERVQKLLEELRTKNKDNALSTSAQKTAQLQEEAEKLLSEIERLEMQVRNK